jgi:hypothetical protein
MLCKECREYLAGINVAPWAHCHHVEEKFCRCKIYPGQAIRIEDINNPVCTKCGKPFMVEGKKVIKCVVCGFGRLQRPAFWEDNHYKYCPYCGDILVD